MKKKEKVKKVKKVKRSKVSLFFMLLILSLFPLIISVAAVSAISVSITRENMEEAAESTLYIVANDLSNYCHQNKIDAITSQNYYEYLDSLKEKNIEMAILIDGAPGATSIKNANDYRVREIECEKSITADKAEIENGYFDNSVMIDEKEYFGYYMPISADGEYIGFAFAGEETADVYGAIQKIVVTFIGVAVCFIVIFAIITLIFSTNLSKVFKVVNGNVIELAQGDLSKNKKVKGKVKEFDMLIAATDTMQENLSEIIGKVKGASETLVDNVVEVTRLTSSSSGRAKQITTAMDELANSTAGMAENVQDINEQMMEIGNCVNDISQNVDYLSGSSEAIQRTNTEALASMEVIMANSKKSVEAVQDIASQIHETNDSIAEIDQAVELILSISNQTKMLSLNASIEAARAGTFGKGFAVVAEEINRLSAQSAEGAEMIKNLAQTITEKSMKSVELTDSVQALIEEEQRNVADTQEKYIKLSDDINQSVTEIKSIAEKTDYLSVYKEKVIDNVQNLSAISEENTASNQEVCANVSEIMTEVQVVNENCKVMDDMAKELSESVAYFHE